MYLDDTIFACLCQGFLFVCDLSQGKKIMEKPFDPEKSKLYRELSRKTYRLCLHKTSKEVLRALLFYFVYCESVFPGQKALAKHLKITTRTVINHLNRLEAKGYITRTGKRSCFLTQIYLIHIDKVDYLLREKSPPPLSASNTGSERPTEKKISSKASHKISPKYIEYKKASLGEQVPFQKPELQKTQEASFKQEKVLSLRLSEQEKQLAQTMIHIMAEETGGVIKPDPQYRCTFRKLVGYLTHRCENDLEQWRTFCQKVSTSSYLMGRSNGFNPPLLWLIKDEILNKMKAGEFHRNLNPKTGNTYALRSFSKPSWLNQSVRSFESEMVKDLEDLLIRERQIRAASLSSEEDTTLRRSFEDKMSSEGSWSGDHFRRSGWDSSHIRDVFQDFKINTLCGSFSEELQKRITAEKESNTRHKREEAA